MSDTTVISIRLDPQTLRRLREAAREAAQPFSRHAADRLAASLAGKAPPSAGDLDDDPLVTATANLFDSKAVAGLDGIAQREAAVLLARIAARGGSGSVAAVVELRKAFAEQAKIKDPSKPGALALLRAQSAASNTAGNQQDRSAK